MVGTRHLRSPATVPTTGPSMGPTHGVTVPMVAATGGAGRSTVAALLAQAFASDARTAVVDTAHPNASPWRTWVTRPGGRPMPTIVPTDRQELFDACAVLATGTGAVIDVLADTTARPIDGVRPVEVATWREMANALGHRVVVVDTGTGLLTDTFSQDPNSDPECASDPTSAGRWLEAPQMVPVLTAPASPAGVDDALVMVTMLEDAGVPAGRVTVAVVGIAATACPRRVLAGLTLLEPRVAAVVRIPHDRRIRATGRPRLDQATKPARRAVRLLADTVTAVADRQSSTPDPATTPAAATTQP